MSFAFGFASDDIEQDEEDVRMEEDAVRDEGVALIPPQVHEFEDMLSGLPASLSYMQHAPLPPRRALYDMRAQLMSESDPSSATPGLSDDDIQPGLYEGGFKTWECATDLAAFAPSRLAALDGALHIIELGAGTAVPSCALLSQHLARKLPAASVALTVADYNLSVLRLASAPNVFLAAAAALNLLAPGAEHDIEVSPSLCRAVREGLAARAVRVRCIEGAWGPGFVELVGAAKADCTLVLASETVYAPTSIAPFVDTLLGILRQSGGLALVAAKRVYFGVGGGVAEFVQEVHRRGGTADEVWQSTGGVGRCILEVRV